MSYQGKTVTIFGGTGFVGRHIVRLLAKEGVTIKVATRIPERAFFLRPCGVVGQIVPIACNHQDEASISAAIKGSDWVINCIGIAYQKRKNTFRRTHVNVAAAIAAACAAHNVSRLVHISALGVDTGKSKYAKTKFEGEHAVFAGFPNATILRPSVIFGPEDNFFNMFAELSRYAPVLPLIGGGKTKFQPVYVSDVAQAVLNCLTIPAGAPNDPRGKTFELGGPETVTFRDIYARLFAATGRKRCLVTLPWGIAKVQASFMSLMPRPMLTPDRVESLKTDSVVAPSALSLENLGIKPVAMDYVLPEYLAAYRSGGQFADKKRA